MVNATDSHEQVWIVNTEVALPMVEERPLPFCHPSEGIIRGMNADTDSIYEELWRLLEEGSSNRRHPFHTPVLATSMSSGDPDLRTVVLRRVDRGRRLVCCHTDARSPKVGEIRSSNRVAWLFYDPKARVQIRAHGRCEIHQGPADAMAQETWHKVRPDSRVCYSAPHSPSSVLDRWESNQAADARDIASTKPMADDQPSPLQSWNGA